MVSIFFILTFSRSWLYNLILFLFSGLKVSYLSAHLFYNLRVRWVYEFIGLLGGDYGFPINLFVTGFPIDFHVSSKYV